MMSNNDGNLKSIVNKASKLLIKDTNKEKRLFENKIISGFQCLINASNSFSDITV